MLHYTNHKKLPAMKLYTQIGNLSKQIIYKLYMYTYLVSITWYYTKKDYYYKVQEIANLQAIQNKFY